MSGNASRSKGRRGESAFKNLLTSRDWTVADLSSGLASEDLLVIDGDGVTWACEVKNTMNILQAHYFQAKKQALKRKARWMLANKLHGSSSWLVRRQGERPVIWHEKGEENAD